MSTLLLWAGLWVTLIVAVLFLVRDLTSNAPLLEFLPVSMLTWAGLFGVALVVLGLILQVIDRIFKPGTRSRCVVCRRPIRRGEMYCRTHLRSILEEEHDRNHDIRPGRDR
ncbi:MAG: hypothetical protein WBX15_17685 [Thermoanaerobaculia bacterium]